METINEKIVIYQVFTRLFGNECTTCIPDGSLEQNGTGKLKDFSPKVLREIKKLGATHIWYTGVLEHATQTDYSAFCIHHDHPAVVKGKAGSPYAIKDYYDIDPDLAMNVPQRMKEFEALITRTHAAGLKMIIDFVPNHVARQYSSDAKPLGVQDLGVKDNTRKSFDPQNNFYYIPNLPFQGQFDLLAGDEESYYEMPAKATGNDRFDAYPSTNDWYETVKLNYGIDYVGGHRKFFDPIPNTWTKMVQVLKFWATKGIDGFRCDMAEMVPVEFWHYAIAQVKKKSPKIQFIAEVYNPNEYRNYIFQGGFDFLYDKVGLYDTLRAILSGQESTKALSNCWQNIEGIQDKMLNFLENHDEQRIASTFFAGDPWKALPALLVSTLMNTNPMMIYFGQELGEPGMDNEGFSGYDGRTTIFDYWSVASIRAWKNEGKWNDELLTESQKKLRAYYTKVLNLCQKEEAIRSGSFYDLMYVNPNSSSFNADRQYAFLRKKDKELIVVIVNFENETKGVGIHIPQHAFETLGIKPQVSIKAKDLLTNEILTVSLSPDKLLSTHLEGNNGKVLKIILK
ncbi:MAG: alpha-amylase family protein [Bacteroidaceae bacterium]